MKKEDVPQDTGYMESTPCRDVYYALDEQGHYCQVVSAGWDAKTDALSMTWNNIREEAEETRREVIAGKKSPLAYHLQMRLLNVALLSAYTGIPRRIIKKHLKVAEFNKAERVFLEVYARTLEMSVDDLKKV